MNESKIVTEVEAIQALLDRAFTEDIDSGDVTTNAIIDGSSRAKAVWVSKEQGIIAGLDIAHSVFKRLDPQITWVPKIKDGDEVEIHTEVVEIEGACRAILTAERIALNIVQRMSGIATMTSRYVEAISKTSARILDTRKTVPGLRLLDKYAVAAGGGTNHRMGLFDMAMIKDNHIVAAGSIENAVKLVRKHNSDIGIEVETTTLDQVKKALKAGADIIMLDNMEIDVMQQAVAFVNGKVETEASGNITLQRVRDVAETGVNYISIGALTHSVKAFDISQQIQNIFK